MYDIIIIGQDLSSLIAALASAQRGLSTILLTEGVNDPSLREEGYAFPADQAPISGFGEGQTLQRLLSELKLPSTEAPAFVMMDPAFQVILPSHRVDLFHDNGRMIDDLIRELSGEEKEIHRFYKSIATAGTLIAQWIGEDIARDRQNLRKMLHRLLRIPSAINGFVPPLLWGNGNSNAFKRIIETQIVLLSQLDPYRGILPLSASYLLSLPSQGIFYPIGGRSALRNWILRGFTDAGGIVMEGCSVIRIDTKRKISVDIEQSGEPTGISGRKLIVSALWEKLNLLLLHKKGFRCTARRIESFQQSGFPFCVHLGVNENGLPEQLAPYAVVVRDETKPASGMNVVFVETSLPGDKERAPEGKRAINAKVFLNTSPLLLADLELKEVAKLIIDSLEGPLPFLRESIDYLNIDKSIALSRQYQEIVSHRYRSNKYFLMGMTTLSPKTPHSDVFLTGAIFRAGLGFEGEILSGMDSAFFAGKKMRADG